MSEIQKHLLEINDVEGAFVLCYHACQMDQSIIAFACIESASQMDELQIEKYLRNKLPEYMIPQVLIIEELPLLVNGKIDRQTLIKLYETSINDENGMVIYDYTGVAENEMKMARILFETIDEVIRKSARASISLKSNFFACGGNSFNSIHTIAKLRDQGYYIEISDFLSANNLREILDRMKQMNGNHDQNIMSVKNKTSFIVEPLKMEHKDEAVQ